ncbi:MAG: polyphosphate polymerase domain-containing protein [Lachnospiraceae bacterium]|nr:polyphosphate polymerase domain-containing protein [Lachnospiraceae bacterium]
MLTVYRKEIKYVIPIEEYLRIKIPLEAIMKKDIYGDQGTYMVRSQYYDSLYNRDLHDNLSGIMEKRKIRIRLYSTKDETVKLEYKCKSNTDSLKRSILMSRKEAQQMESHQYEFLLNRTEDLATELYQRMMQGCYRPKTIITYQRGALSYPDSDLRITFDTDLRATINPYGLFDEETMQIPMMSQDVGILEVKYNNYLPYPIKEIVNSIDQLAEANSKYSSARLMYIY